MQRVRFRGLPGWWAPAPRLLYLDSDAGIQPLTEEEAQELQRVPRDPQAEVQRRNTLRAIRAVEMQEVKAYPPLLVQVLLQGADLQLTLASPPLKEDLFARLKGWRDTHLHGALDIEMSKYSTAALKKAFRATQGGPHSFRGGWGRQKLEASAKSLSDSDAQIFLKFLREQGHLAQGWRKKEDLPVRQEMMRLIAGKMSHRPPQRVIRAFELRLYRRAGSLGEYADKRTLNSRLKEMARGIVAVKQASEATQEPKAKKMRL